MIKRRKTRVVRVGKVKIGGDNPVSVQSMTKTRTRDVEIVRDEIRRLSVSGCEIVRVAVKSPEDARAIREIKNEISLPVVADIHFDHMLALLAIDNGADKIRVNPGNITRSDHLNAIIDRSKEKGIAVRIGLNSGSLPAPRTDRKSPDEIMVDEALRYIDIFEKKGFDDLVVSLKSSDIITTIKAYRDIAPKTDVPLHLGITAAGTPSDGIVRSSVGIGSLLASGIGDTIRVSLTGDPVLEVETGKRILQSLGLREYGHKIISCPTCGRCQVDMVVITGEIEARLKGEISIPGSKKLNIAVMGCEVNGPGEAKDADIGIAFGSNKGAIFSRGNIVKTVNVDEAVEEFLRLIREMAVKGKQ
ncbi:MAG: flavodoxin-dependent (E)-4-hydroxy-3-methylbut-2-enyl-diphosphate synthase [Candidatus Omnitrophica bacterium]|nr:flavodoxin-dependent (E)-4-hydroxy-3-methylbut-2-enyl-diphosphate synthase [Candidatus Omnitrophota bacterium]